MGSSRTSSSDEGISERLITTKPSGNSTQNALAKPVQTGNPLNSQPGRPIGGLFGTIALGVRVVVNNVTSGASKVAGRIKKPFHRKKKSEAPKQSDERRRLIPNIHNLNPDEFGTSGTLYAPREGDLQTDGGVIDRTRAARVPLREDSRLSRHDKIQDAKYSDVNDRSRGSWVDPRTGKSIDVPQTPPSRQREFDGSDLSARRWSADGTMHRNARLVPNLRSGLMRERKHDGDSSDLESVASGASPEQRSSRAILARMAGHVVDTKRSESRPFLAYREDVGRKFYAASIASDESDRGSVEARHLPPPFFTAKPSHFVRDSLAQTRSATSPAGSLELSPSQNLAKDIINSAIKELGKSSANVDWSGVAVALMSSLTSTDRSIAEKSIQTNVPSGDRAGFNPWSRKRNAGSALGDFSMASPIASYLKQNGVCDENMKQMLQNMCVLSRQIQDTASSMKVFSKDGTSGLRSFRVVRMLCGIGDENKAAKNDNAGEISGSYSRFIKDGSELPGFYNKFIDKLPPSPSVFHPSAMQTRGRESQSAVQAI